MGVTGLEPRCSTLWGQGFQILGLGHLITGMSDLEYNTTTGSDRCSQTHDAVGRSHTPAGPNHTHVGPQAVVAA